VQQKKKEVTQRENPATMEVADSHEGGTSMSHYHHLSISERESIWENKILGKSLHQIAEITGRSVSTLSRELRRNKGSHRRYQPSEAQKHYEKRRKNCHRHRILEQGELRDTVAALLTEQQWSPEQIAERLALERGGSVVSYATIYRTLRSGWMEAKGTKRNRHGRYPMQKHLRRKGHKRKAPGKKTQYFVHQTIENRPPEAENRLQMGHWEGDLVYSSFHKVYIVTLVDRCSRYLLTDVCNSKKPSEVAAVICSMLKSLPPWRVRSITLDRGPEFADHPKVTAELPSAQFYFAHPYSPWERGLNENTNGLLRQYVPKYTYKVPFSPEFLRKFTQKLNLRPRKCLAWRSPYEVFFDKVLHLT